MAVRVITAPPGSGKTLNMSRIAKDLYDEHNKINIIRKRVNLPKVNIYSNYPIMVEKRKEPFKYLNGADVEIDATPNLSEEGFTEADVKVLKELYPSRKFKEDFIYYGAFSNKLKFTDMRLKYRFCENASFFIDEISFIYDSMEYKDFPDCIAHFFFVHRHLGYNMIYTNSQSLSRIIKRVLVISEEYWNILELRNFFWLFTRVTFKVTNDIKGSKDFENLEDDLRSEIVTKWFIRKRAYDTYESKYFGMLNKDLPMYDINNYNSKVMSKDDIINGFIIPYSIKEELKNQIF